MKTNSLKSWALFIRQGAENRRNATRELRTTSNLAEESEDQAPKPAKASEQNWIAFIFSALLEKTEEVEGKGLFDYEIETSLISHSFLFLAQACNLIAPLNRNPRKIYGLGGSHQSDIWFVKSYSFKNLNILRM